MSYVLDASALLALILNEPGQDIVRSRTREACMSSVNATEVLTRCLEKGIPVSEAEALLWGERIDIIDFDLSFARIAAELRAATKSFGFSLADRACIALALHRKATILTADRIWGKLDLGCSVTLIR
jgi:ribonuclease VapC